jgi:hypothetical protein
MRELAGGIEHPRELPAVEDLPNADAIMPPDHASRPVLPARHCPWASSLNHGSVGKRVLTM